ncbi:MAG: anaerobic sulfatase-maturation protein [Bacteroidota bacterium]|nr:anaerobic sulfatase-maturation protein [Bacteroidota bacterium]
MNHTPRHRMKKTLQFNPLKYPVYVMAKPIGAACNLRCNYCYFLEKEKLRPRNSSPKMNDALLEEFTQQYINAQPIEQVLFTWHGGEPLLLGIDYFRKALHYQKKYARGRQIDNVLQTNGTLLTDDWCRFFKANNFLIGLSLDGPEHCHDRYRKDIAGKGSFAEVVRAVELLQLHEVEFNILSVVNDYNVKYPLEVYHFFKSIGAQYIQFSPVVERLSPDSELLATPEEQDIALTSWSVPALEYGKFLTAIFDEWVRNDVGRIFVTTFDNTLAGYAGAPHGTCIFSPTCGHAAALSPNGDLYACDHYVFPQYNRGNIREKTITEMMLSKEQIQFGNDKAERLTQTCRQCEYLKLCNGECPKNRIVRIPGEPNDHNYLCAGLKHYFRHTEQAMRFMANELSFKRTPANVMLQFQQQ